MLLRIASLMLLSLLLCQNGAASKDAQPAPYEDAEAYAVYSAILPTSWIWETQKARSLVIRAETISYKMCLIPEADAKEIVGPAISEYVRLNEKPWQLQRKLSIEKPYELVDSDELNKTFYKSDEMAFEKRHPKSGGVIALSAVGFNHDKTVAIVFMAHSCGSLCGGGEYYVLQKKDGKWIPLRWNGSSCGFAI